MIFSAKSDYLYHYKSNFIFTKEGSREQGIKSQKKCALWE